MSAVSVTFGVGLEEVKVREKYGRYAVAIISLSRIVADASCGNCDPGRVGRREIIFKKTD